MPHGLGTLYFKNGTIVDGRFDAGIMKEMILASEDHQEPTAATPPPPPPPTTTTTTTTVDGEMSSKYFMSPKKVSSYLAGQKVKVLKI